MLLYGLILFVMSFDKRHRKWHVTAFSAVAVAELCVTAVLGFDYIGQISVPKFFSGTEDMEEAVDALDDGTFYRSELADAKMVNENAWYRLNAVGLFGSTAADGMVKIMDSLGFYTGANEYLTATRMDKYAPTLLDLGEKAMIGKGKRSKEVIDAIIRNKAVYFAAIGGAGALLSKCITKSEIVCYEDLGAEAIRKLEVKDFPVIVVIDRDGNNLYETAIEKYKKIQL